MSTISTHVLDTALGRPAVGLSVSLERIDSRGAATRLGAGITDADGRVRTLLAAGRSLEQGDYRLRFDTAAYLAQAGHAVFYPVVSVDFRVSETGAHYHVPLLLSPFGYSTYRGS
jgi:5-hydroxyisourate hydrolase